MTNQAFVRTWKKCDDTVHWAREQSTNGIFHDQSCYDALSWNWRWMLHALFATETSRECLNTSMIPWHIAWELEILFRIPLILLKKVDRYRSRPINSLWYFFFRMKSGSTWPMTASYFLFGFIWIFLAISWPLKSGHSYLFKSRFSLWSLGVPN